jgi:hypothetical protein
VCACVYSIQYVYRQNVNGLHAVHMLNIVNTRTVSIQNPWCDV